MANSFVQSGPQSGTEHFQVKKGPNSQAPSTTIDAEPAQYFGAGTKGIFAHRHANGTLQAYVASNKPEGWITGIDFSDPVTAMARVAEEFGGWAPELTALITNGETEPVLRPIHALPIEDRWNRVAGVTLLGDAAHLMSPFAGEGASVVRFPVICATWLRQHLFRRDCRLLTDAPKARS